MLRKLYYFLIYILKAPRLLVGGSSVHHSSRIAKTTTIVRSTVGRYNYLGGEVYLVDVVMGNYCSIAAGVKIGGMEHSWWWLSTSTHLSEHNVSGKKTTIGHDVWVGVNAFIKQGITVGNGAVIGAGAVVLKDVEPYTVVVGCPAKLVRPRFEKELMEKIEATRYWDQEPVEAQHLLKSLS